MLACIILATTLIGALLAQKYSKCSIGLPFFLGGMAMVTFQVIGVKEALLSIDWDVMGFLFGTFIIAQGLSSSGLSWQMAYRASRIKIHPRLFLLLFIYIIGLFSALLMNDTIAIVGTPIVIFLFQSQDKLKKLFIIALAISITIGSIISATGNPQNLIIATHASPAINYMVFIKHLLVPSISSLALLFIILALTHWNLLKEPFIRIKKKPIQDKHLAKRSILSVVIFLLLIIAHIIVSYQYPSRHIPYSVIALTASLPLLIYDKSGHLIKHIDWHTLLFFIGLFIMSKSIWDMALFQHLLSTHQAMLTQPLIMSISVIALSQLISNVAIAAIFLPLLQSVKASPHLYLLLAASSTLAGNIFIISAASNVIILQAARNLGSKEFPTLKFFLIGLPTSLISLCIFLFFI